MQRAIALVLLADLWWGISALYWRELDSIAPADQLWWRIALGTATLGTFWLVRRRWPFRDLTRRKLLFGLAGTASITLNWAVFLWAIANDQAVDAALGYFLTPIVAVALGVGVLGERLARLHVVALAFAVAGIGWLFVQQGGVPWVALVLGVSFGVYGLTRKTGPWDSVDGLTIEMASVAPVAIIMLLLRSTDPTISVDGDGALRTLLLLACSGVATAMPLVLFANAARKAPLAVVGLLQYVVPIAQFIVGWWVFGESVPAQRFVGFALVWVAVVCVIVNEFRPTSRAEVSVGRAS